MYKKIARSLSPIFLAGAISISALAAPVFNIGPNACPTALAACQASNQFVVANLFTPVLLTSSDISGGILNDFQSAFNSWNSSLAAGSKWTLQTAELSDTAILTLDIYRAYVNDGPGCGDHCGGAEIDITYIPGAPTDPPGIIDPKHIGAADAVWSQSVSTNQKRDPSLPGNPYLDNAPDTPNPELGPPAYPFQYTGSSFYDKPGRDATAIWIGDAYISTADYTSRVLTVYDGVEWGFTVTPVPEPATILLSAFGLLLVLVFRRRRKHFPA